MTRREFLFTAIPGFTLGVMVTTSQDFKRSERFDIPVLMYHDISNHYRDDFTIPPFLFYAHMEYLYQMGYRAVFPEELKILNSDEKIFMLTFDDGYLSFMEYAFPILKDYEFKAIINVIGAYVGKYYKLTGNRPTLGWDDYRFLLSSGIVRVGYHGYDIHVINWVRRFTSEQLREDAIKFLDRLNKELGISTDIFAAPYGQYSERYIEVLRKLGFRYFFTSTEGLLKPGEVLVPRLNINHLIDLVSFKEYIGGIKP